MSDRIKLANSRNTVATHPNGTKPTPPNKGGKGSSGAKGAK